MSGKAGPQNSTALQSRQSGVPAEVALAQTLALGPHSARQSHNGPGPGVDLLFQLSPVSTQDLKVADLSI